MVALGDESLQNVSNLFYGDWSHVELIRDPVGVPVPHYMGLVQDAALEISREDSEVLGTTFPRFAEVIVAATAGMQFTGTVNELHLENVNFMMGNLPNVANRYLYPGASCPNETDFVRFIARRTRCDGFVMEALFWKAQSNGLIQIGVGDIVAGSPMEVNALNDTNSGFGGSAAAPLGYLLVPPRVP